MLDLQKASAGSGKTYTLARQYLEFILVTGNPPRLRQRAEIEDALRHILAITFTNKATAEMKGRIVSQLAALAGHPDEKGEKKSDYIKYFTELVGKSAQEVEQTAEMALAVMLNDYTDFQISTIDAFFQTILRTFAFEIGLNDSYGIEIDNDYIAQSAIDSALSDVNAEKGTHGAVEQWITEFMTTSLNNNGTSWNIFFKRGENSVYDKLFKSVKKMSSESFKTVSESLAKFYSARPDTLADFKDLDDYFKNKQVAPLVRAKKLAQKLNVLKSSLEKLDNNGIKLVQKVIDIPVSRPHLTEVKKFRDSKFEGKKAFNKGALTGGVYDEYKDTFSDMIQELLSWRAEGKKTDQALWTAYREQYRMLPFMHYMAQKSAEMLRDANVLNMAETTTILRRVIGDDDAPFIYERLGNRLEHYLIDEFQDTSALQWDNLRPLLDESMSHGHRNLIIGDAKQSIYRFRNADPSLITFRVPKEYAGRINLKGDTPAENTNYRSLRNVVEFNNTLFAGLAERWDKRQSDDLGEDSTFYRNLYSGVEQESANKEYLGYVDIRKVAKDDEYDSIAPLISELRHRGYCLADIAILVEKNSTAGTITKKLRLYNAEHPDDVIEFVGDNTLLISESAAVKVILSILKLIAEGAFTGNQEIEQLLSGEETPKNTREGEHPKDKEEAVSQRKEPKPSVDMFNCRYQLIALDHPDYSVEEIISEMNTGKVNVEPIMKLLEASGSLALPALVETIVLKFISEADRQRHAPFIAAFQDMVLDFCERYPSDVVSFLQWWKEKGEREFISTPEGVDAVNIMTIHKSKGLEYQCVILPELKKGLSVSDGEWRWVKTEKGAMNLPPELAEMVPDHIAVTASSNLLDTPHKDEYIEYLRQARMDNLNNLYVACTRAVAELYILAEAGSGEPVDTMMESIVKRAENSVDKENGIRRDLLSVLKDSEGADAKVVGVSYGQPLEKEEIKCLKSKLENVKGDPIKEYEVTDSKDVLHYRDAEGGHSYSDTPDPRSFGTKLHGIMEKVYELKDLRRSILEKIISGVLSDAEGEEAYGLLMGKMSQPLYPGRKDSPKARDWFRRGLRVINERSLLRPRQQMRRPDRIVVDEEDNATVIDYKFGEEDPSDHTDQVRGYMKALRETGSFRRVKGYLWYVMQDRIVEVQ